MSIVIMGALHVNRSAMGIWNVLLFLFYIYKISICSLSLMLLACLSDILPWLDSDWTKALLKKKKIYWMSQNKTVQWLLEFGWTKTFLLFSWTMTNLALSGNWLCFNFPFFVFGNDGNVESRFSEFVTCEVRFLRLHNTKLTNSFNPLMSL